MRSSWQPYIRHAQCPSCKTELVLTRDSADDTLWVEVAPPTPHPVEWVADTILDDGFYILDYGYLEEVYGGHEVGTPYVDIVCRCGDDRDRARQRLEKRSGLPALAWDCGWTAIDGALVGLLYPYRSVTMLRIFPDAKAN